MPVLNVRVRVTESPDKKYGGWATYDSRLWIEFEAVPCSEWEVVWLRLECQGADMSPYGDPMLVPDPKAPLTIVLHGEIRDPDDWSEDGDEVETIAMRASSTVRFGETVVTLAADR
jgi:hypothetical protein